ncbi:RHS repeat-associated core domain-containing protein [Micromonospora eburnea]|uniref:RHS repeat-associated core domain-containing protein n=1 Tax=Micromonospora eburnea TaxID=227316 RepID=A0A1C6U7R7_9ACTN|nr:RHS repeat-associated core domain-containing protein [Micromonospora eburnea]SCL50120.1 RHS repeat-associated core domain-containing protein [Micromonospora eburnea]
MTTEYDKTTGLPTSLKTTDGNSTYVAAQDYTSYGEPTVTKRKTATGKYVDDVTDYDLTTRRIARTAIKPENVASTVSDRNYTYDDAGNITSIADTPQIGAADTQCFRQDKLRRLTSAWTPKAGITCDTDPTVANLGGPAPYWLDWSFDAVGNRTEEISHSSAGETKRTYDVPTGGPGVVRPHAVTEVTTTAPGQNPVTTNYDYDSTGNTTCRPAGTTANTCPPPGNGSQNLTWDAEGHLASVTHGGTTVETNIYDADGNRLIRRDATGTTLYLPGQEIRRDNSSITTGTRYYTFAGKLVASRNGSGLTWVYSDHQGTQHTAIDAASQAVTTRRQTPYGRSRGTQPAWPNPKGFVGGDPDPTGLTHLGAREYDPAIGRFVSVDPLMNTADPQQWNGYNYANSSPVTHSDPTGRSPEDAQWSTGKPSHHSEINTQLRYGGSGCGGECKARQRGGKKNNTWGPVRFGCQVPLSCKGLSPSTKPAAQADPPRPTGQWLCLAKKCVKGSPMMQCASDGDCSNVYPYMEGGDYNCGRSFLCILKGTADVIGIALIISAPALAATAGPAFGMRTLYVTAANPSASELRAAQYMLDRGASRVILRDPVGTRAGGMTSDLLVDGVNWDVYTPTSGTVKSILSKVAKKHDQVHGGGVIVDLAEVDLSAEQFGDNALIRVKGFIRSWGGQPMRGVEFIGG